MSFSEEMARVVADQLARFVTLNTHQLAGHVANLDFWVSEARHVLEVIDGYEPRFRRMKAGQEQHVVKHGTFTHLLGDIDPWFGEPEIRSVPDPPRRVGHATLRQARRSVTEATYRFLVRCCNEGLIPESKMRAICEELDIGVEAADLR